jgi:hypothetical protein
MGKEHDGIDDRLAAFIARQRLFFVGTAPLDGDGHVNLSPKGPIGTLRVLGPHRVAYLDLVGSGAETIAHLRENGRIVLMLCAFEGPPRIVRLHGRGTAVLAGDPRFTDLVAELGLGDDPSAPAARRALIDVDVQRVADSCGYGVPLMSYEGERPHLHAWSDKKLRVGGPEALEAFKAQHNAESLDGLPAVGP